MSNVLLRALDASEKPMTQSALSWLRQTSTVATMIDGGYVLVDFYGEKGVRKSMDDECVVCPSLSALNSDLPPTYEFLVCGLFDGHGGRSCAAFAKEHLLKEVANQLVQHLRNSKDNGSKFSELLLKKSVNAACSRLDSRIANELPNCTDGCTALLVFVGRNRVFVMNLGDSSAYMCRRLQGAVHAIPLNEVHKAWSQKEKERVLHYGGTVEGGRINGVLEVSRSFGDLSLKRFGVKCTGSLRRAALDMNADEFILVGCDGFWGAYDPREACRNALTFIKEEEARAKADPRNPFVNLHKVCKDLVNHALNTKHAQDNISVLLLRFVCTAEST
ncbi:protein phosphatase 2C, putative [Babesia bigemina]|uniref:protein-serine/threonine phosphatase n=1 Tax=Babesia bigemina TaxID=5866 RepID=A0A061DCM1_BABBI|nr:protein phosphatase 2C, putative [Babesia bigemina]CDR97867.1 protein phosphatase 2C, putative [Babesia bigemina]|eukprot:XP_012770053.1 protein phosphatase 2C, putative [Babesia bigemina]